MTRWLRLSSLSLVFALMGGGIGYLLLPERAPQAAGVPRVRVRGRPVTLGADPHAQAREIARSYLREHVTIVAEDHTLDRTRESLGARVDVRLLEHLLRAAGDPSSALVRHHAALARGPIELPLPVRRTRPGRCRAARGSPAAARRRCARRRAGGRPPP